jgi:hypothetical protein
VHNPTRARTVGVEGDIAYNARVRNQLTGLDLTGYAGDRVSSDDSVAGGW